MKAAARRLRRNFFSVVGVVRRSSAAIAKTCEAIDRVRAGAWRPRRRLRVFVLDLPERFEQPSSFGRGFAFDLRPAGNYTIPYGVL
jgi:hypothetical protein